jgi:hypothetical protein
MAKSRSAFASDGSVGGWDAGIGGGSSWKTWQGQEFILPESTNAVAAGPRTFFPSSGNFSVSATSDTVDESDAHDVFDPPAPA